MTRNARRGLLEPDAWKSGKSGSEGGPPAAMRVVLPDWDAFHYTELDPVLRNLGAQRLIVAGLQTNVCIETTARAAMMRNFEVAVPEDAVSTDGTALHFGALDAMRVLYIEIAPWRELIAPDAAWDRAFTTPHYGRTALPAPCRQDQSW